MSDVRDEPATTFTTYADPMDRNAGRPPSLGPIGLLRWAWRRLITMRTALILLLLLALAAIPGSLIPQRTSDAVAVGDFIAEHPELSAWYSRLGLFDVYGSPWFGAIYLLLFISLVGCLLPRARQYWRQWRAGPASPPRHPDRLADTELITTTDPGAVLDRGAAALRARRWRVRRGDGWVAAERGSLREAGNQLFHFALLGVLAAIGYGALTGWHGNVVLREGTGFADTLNQYDSFTAGRFADSAALPAFTLHLDSFEVEFERGEAQRGAPREFDAQVTVTDAAGQVSRQTLAVNAPLHVDGADVFLLGHGYAPRFKVTDASGQVVFDDSVTFMQRDGNFTSVGVLKLPDAEPQLAFSALLTPTTTIDPVAGPVSVFPAPDDPAVFVSAFTGDLGLDTGVAQNVFTLDTTDLDRLGIEALREGQTWRLPDGAGSIEFTGLDRWISIKVGHDAGGAWALGFIALAIVGISLSLFVKRRRLWLVTTADGVLVAGSARGDNVAIGADVAATAATCRGSAAPR